MSLQRGFSLIELAIVLVIVTILIGGLAVPLSAQIQARRIAETQRTLEEAKEAVIGYARTHPIAGALGYRHLPCPDSVGNDGKEDRSGDACSSPSGLLPWVDLGVASQDAWGNRLRYAVVGQFADKGTNGGFSASMPLPRPAPIEICSTHLCSSPDVATDVSFVIISHGPNGWGAQNLNNAPGSLQAPPNGLDEVDNLDTNSRYISRAPTQPNTPSGEFDDFSTWVSFSRLIPSVCPAGGCP